MTRTISALAALTLLLGGVAQAEAGIIVSDGYFDLTQAQYPNGLPAPNPWVGSPNTTFYGNVSAATSSDPDENAVLFQNTGPGAVTLSALSIGSFNLFSVDNVAGPVTILPNANAIFAGVDGSDVSSGPVVAFTLNNQPITFNDPKGAAFTNGALFGNTKLGSADETVPWTVGYSTPVPEPSTLALLGMASASLARYGWRRRKQQAARS